MTIQTVVEKPSDEEIENIKKQLEGEEKEE